MPPSQQPDQSPRAAYRAFIDQFFPDDAEVIKVRLDNVVQSAAHRAQVPFDAVWQALCGGIFEWERQRMLALVTNGTAPSPDDHSMKDIEGFHPNWLLNRSLAETIRVHQRAAKHLQALEDWAKEFSTSEDQHSDALAAIREEIESGIEGIEEWKSVAGRPPGRNWEAWNAAKKCLIAAGVTNENDLSELFDASNLAKPDPAARLK